MPQSTPVKQEQERVSLGKQRPQRFHFLCPACLSGRMLGTGPRL